MVFKELYEKNLSEENLPCTRPLSSRICDVDCPAVSARRRSKPEALSLSCMFFARDQSMPRYFCSDM